MRRYLKEFRFNNTDVVIGNLEFIDYDSVKNKNTGEYYKLSKEASKVLFSNIGMKNRQFSKTLFEVSKPTWDSLVALKCSNPEVQEFMFSSKGVVLGNTIASVVKGNPNLDRLKAILDSYSDENTECFYHYDDPNTLQFLCIDKASKIGVLAYFYIDSNWLSLYNVFKDEDDLLNISPYLVYNNEIQDDLEMVLAKDVILGGAKISLDSDSIRDEYRELLCVPVSSEELTYYMKKLLKVKLDGNKAVNLSTVAENLELDSMTTSKLLYLESKLDNDTDEVKNSFYSNYLKRSITMTSVTYGVLLDLAWCLVDEELLDIKYMIEIYNTLVRRKCHYFCIN